MDCAPGHGPRTCRDILRRVVGMGGSPIRMQVRGRCVATDGTSVAPQRTTKADRLWIRRKFWRGRVAARRTAWGLPLAAWRSVPDVLIVGAQRSGTTSLYRHLSGHPSLLWSPMVKSPHWLDVRYDRPERWYRAHYPLDWSLRRHGERRLTAEASPYFLFHPTVPERIGDHLPDARMLAILRDPTDRAWSHYQHERARGYEDLDFAAALDAEERRIAPERPHLSTPGYVGYHHRHHAYVGRGLYAEQIERYHRHLPPEQLLVLFTHELKDAPQATFDRVCDFLEIPRLELVEPPRHHTRQYERLDEDLRTRLDQRFATPNRDLERLLGRTLPWATP